MTTQTTPSKIALKYGIILGIIFIIYGTILQLLDLDMQTANYLGWLNFVVLLIGIIMAIREYKQETGGFMTFGQGLGLGTLLSFVSGAISALFTYFYIKFIDGSLMEKIKEAQLIELEKQDLSDEQMEQTMEMMDKFTGAGVIAISSVFMCLLLGFIFSLIVSAIMKNEPAERNILDVE